MPAGRKRDDTGQQHSSDIQPPQDSGTINPRVRPLSDFTDAAEALTYGANFIRQFDAFSKTYGLAATSVEQQLEFARLVADVEIALPDFATHEWNHHDRAANQVMMTAINFWKLFKDELPPDEAQRRYDIFVAFLPARVQATMYQEASQCEMMQQRPQQAAEKRRTWLGRRLGGK